MLSPGAWYHSMLAVPHTPHLQATLHRQPTLAAPIVTPDALHPSCRLSCVSCAPSGRSCLAASSPSGPAAKVLHALRPLRTSYYT